jgi:hypothetical protein
MHLYLALAALGLVAVVAVQDVLVPALRSESISAGLTGPYHWYLDASYLILAIALTTAFWGTGLAGVLAGVSSVALILTAVTNTFSIWVDSITNGQHAKWHSIFTGVVFVTALSLQAVVDRGAVAWTLTASNVLAPAVLYLLTRNSPNTEKVGVLILCLWLVSWSL